VFFPQFRDGLTWNIGNLAGIPVAPRADDAGVDLHLIYT
jgi:hypothetical protein